MIIKNSLMIIIDGDEYESVYAGHECVRLCQRVSINILVHKCLFIVAVASKSTAVALRSHMIHFATNIELFLLLAYLQHVHISRETRETASLVSVKKDLNSTE